MTDLVFPIGQFGGALGPAGSPGVFPVRVGDRVWRLDHAPFAVWAFTHGPLDRVGVEPWTVAAVTEALAANGVSDGETQLAALRDDGLVAQVDPADAVGFATRHRLVPLLLGLGEEVEPGDGYPLGLPDRPLITIAGPLYAIWVWADVEADLWSGCRRLAADAQALGGDDPDLVDPSRVLHGVLRGLHPLLAVGAAYLDTVAP